jgi:hypothetical protein
MGYPKWQSGYSSLTYSIIVNIEYNEPVQKCDKKPRHPSFEPYLEEAESLAVAELFKNIKNKT